MSDSFGFYICSQCGATISPSMSHTCYPPPDRTAPTTTTWTASSEAVTALLAERDRLRAAVDKVRELCEQARAPYGERGASFYDGAEQLCHRIERALDEALGGDCE